MNSRPDALGQHHAADVAQVARQVLGNDQHVVLQGDRVCVYISVRLDASSVDSFMTVITYEAYDQHTHTNSVHNVLLIVFPRYYQRYSNSDS